MTATMNSSTELQLLGRIMDFDGTESVWPDFKFQFKGMARKLDPQALEYMTLAESSDPPLDMDKLTVEAKEASARVFF